MQVYTYIIHVSIYMYVYTCVAIAVTWHYTSTLIQTCRGLGVEQFTTFEPQKTQQRKGGENWVRLDLHYIRIYMNTYVHVLVSEQGYFQTGLVCVVTCGEGGILFAILSLVICGTCTSKYRTLNFQK